MSLRRKGKLKSEGESFLKRLEEWARKNTTAMKRTHPEMWEDSINVYQEKLQSRYAFMTPKFLMGALLNTVVNRDTIGFKVVEEEFGTEKAVEIYAEIWTRAWRNSFEPVKRTLGIKEVKDLPTLMKIIKYLFDTFGDIFEIVAANDDGAIGRVLTCPFTEFAWCSFGCETMDGVNMKLHGKIDKCIMRGLLKEAELDDKYNIQYTTQMCNGWAEDEIIFFKKSEDPEKLRAKFRRKVGDRANKPPKLWKSTTER